jgi:polyhydroxybutyrate depolymerase
VYCISRPIGAAILALAGLFSAPSFAQESFQFDDEMTLADSASAYAKESSLEGAQKRSFNLDGRDRSYLVQPAAGFSGPRPIVILLHGASQLAETAWQHSKLPELARREGFIMVSGQGYKRVWNDGRSFTARNFLSADHGVNDVSYLHAVIADVVHRDGGDPNAVFMLGTSSGGFMTMRFACESGDTLRAAAAVNATLPVALAQNCRPAKALPWVFMNGTSDYKVPFNGRARPAWMPAMASFDYFADRAGCSKSPSMAPAARAAQAGAWVERRTRAGCATGTSSTEYIVHKGGHTWPSAIAWKRGGQDVDSANAVWNHFKATLYGH